MVTVSVKKARARLSKLIDQIAADHRPIIITGQQCNAVLLAEEDWNAFTETLHLFSVPGMRESIMEGIEEPIDGCADDLDG